MCTLVLSSNDDCLKKLSASAFTGLGPWPCKNNVYFPTVQPLDGFQGPWNLNGHGHWPMWKVTVISYLSFCSKTCVLFRLSPQVRLNFFKFHSECSGEWNITFPILKRREYPIPSCKYCVARHMDGTTYGWLPIQPNLTSKGQIEVFSKSFNTI